MKTPTTAVMQSTGSDVFIVVDDVRIAKRGQHGTPQARTRISLAPGWKVVDVDGGSEIEATHEGVRIHKRRPSRFVLAARIEQRRDALAGLDTCSR